MSDQIALIHSYDTGYPGNGGYKHYVRFTDNPQAHVVAQMLAGGRFPQDDCAPADALSRMRDDARATTMPLLETICGTQGYGTDINDLERGLNKLGYATHRTGTPTAAWVMNSGPGIKVPPSACQPYIAASDSTTLNPTIVIDTPGAWELHPPAPTQEESMDIRYIPSWNGQQQLIQTDGGGNLIHGWYGGASGWGFETLATGLRPFGSVDWAIIPGQLQIWAQRPTGRRFHAYQVAGQGTWHMEDL